jgi:hypothetical protein
MRMLVSLSNEPAALVDSHNDNSDTYDISKLSRRALKMNSFNAPPTIAGCVSNNDSSKSRILDKSCTPSSEAISDNSNG